MSKMNKTHPQGMDDGGRGGFLESAGGGWGRGQKKDRDTMDIFLQTFTWKSKNWGKREADPR